MGGGSTATPAPSMDISVSSNFERFLFHCTDDNATECNEMMNTFKTTNKIQATPNVFQHAQKYMASGCVNDTDMLKTIIAFKSKYGLKGLLDPHTAIGVSVATDTSKHEISRILQASANPVVCLACAHWAKFPKVKEQAEKLNIQNAKNLESLEQRFTVMDADKMKVRAFVRANLGGGTPSSSSGNFGRNMIIGAAVLAGVVSFIRTSL